jgi:4-hydroxy-4-methyl-2-oxoglutarate aldolase
MDAAVHVSGPRRQDRLRRDGCDAADGDRMPPSALWEHVVELPEPRLVVVEDLDDPRVWVPTGVRSTDPSSPRSGASPSLRTAPCVTWPRCVPSGSKPLPARLPFRTPNVHLVGVREPVTVGGLSLRPGDLLHGDQHGVPPFGIAAALRNAAASSFSSLK